MSFVNSPKPEYAADGLPPEKKNRRRMLIRFIILIVMLVGIGLNIYAWVVNDTVNQIRGTNGAVHGTVTNAENELFENALVFLTLAPDSITTADANGNFNLDNVPTGEQSLIVVNPETEIGQEFYVNVKPNRVTEVETLNYIASPDK